MHESTRNANFERYEQICIIFGSQTVYSSTDCALQVDPRHCFHPVLTLTFIDKCK